MARTTTDLPLPAPATTQERHLAAWLHHLRSLEPGASFHEAEPELPAHWIPGQPHTWTSSTRFVPLATFDYQTPPAGPALHISWSPGASKKELEAFVSAVRQRGVAVYGAGAEDALNRAGDRYYAIVILDAGTTKDALEALLAWADSEDRWVGTYRTGTE